jgi:hypothetical protein
MRVLQRPFPVGGLAQDAPIHMQKEERSTGIDFIKLHFRTKTYSDKFFSLNFGQTYIQK